MNDTSFIVVRLYVDRNKLILTIEIKHMIGFCDKDIFSELTFDEITFKDFGS